jgi:hypothetical protein
MLKTHQILQQKLLLDHPTWSKAGSWAVFLFGLLYCLLWGRIGMFGLDNPIVFDGTWRLMQGQDFFSDFAWGNPIVCN